VEATITLLEYGDFECGHCVEAFAMVKGITRRRRGELRYVFCATFQTQKNNCALLAEEAEAGNRATGDDKRPQGECKCLSFLEASSRLWLRFLWFPRC
jgi:protein-disulfide isomerase